MTSLWHNTDYRNVPKSVDRQVWANSVDPKSDSTLFAILSASFGHITALLNHIVQILW